MSGVAATKLEKRNVEVGCARAESDTMTTGTLTNITVLIPAYKPDETLLTLLNQLKDEGYRRLIVVDDGSGEACERIFERARAVPGVRVLRHAVNMGKGAALLTGLNDALVCDPDIIGVVTADADGQHLPKDIRAIAQDLAANPGALVMGVRAFEGDVPARSALGNSVTRHVFRVVARSKLSDTQTGLRGIPTGSVKDLLTMHANRYEFEMSMLVELRVRGVRVVQREIETVYEPGNPTSHFRAFRDSMRIYSVFARFFVTSGLTFLIDLGVFALVYALSDNIMLSMLIARVCAGVYQFVMCRSFVFRSGRSVRSSAIRYAALVLGSGAVSYGLLTSGVLALNIGVFSGKLIAEAILFIANFAIQRLLVFPPDDELRETQARDLSDAQENRA